MDVIAALLGALGDDVVDADPTDERFYGDWSDAPRQRPLAVVRPRSTYEVATMLRVCHEHGQSVVTQGGLTGLAGAATPGAGDVVLNLERMSGIEEIDESAATVTVRAGTVLSVVQETVAARGFELAYDLGARGSCQIGGNLATNAGGNRVLRFGMVREQVLGLEVVLADGTVVSSMHKMLKNNAGYDIKHLFIGSEGTLGVITRAVLRLHPAPSARHTALVAIESYEGVVEFLRHAQRVCGDITAFELMWPGFYAYMTTHGPLAAPLPVLDAMYVLVEMTGDGVDRFEAMLSDAVERGLLVDATVAQSARDATHFWTIREGEPIDRLPSVINFDVSLAIADIGACAEECERRILERWPDGHVFLFGHIGDSNLHLCVSIGKSSPSEQHGVDEIVYSTVRGFRGSVSAEHGIGTLKRDYLSYSRSPEELEVMRRMKAALDPTSILNPGKVLPVSGR